MDLHATPAAQRHVPVMLDEVLEALAPSLERPGARYVDGTLGMGGHTEAVLERFPNVTAIGIDRDEQALELASERLARFGDRFQPVHGVSFEIASLVDGPIDGMLWDLGVSSLQLDEVERGFAYRTDAPLDMRMDQSGSLTAADVLNTYSQAELEHILKTYGEERYARKIAHAIVKEREVAEWTTSARLVAMLRSIIPAASAKQSGHPAKRTFQALRIEVNNELGGLEEGLPQALDLLSEGGTLVVLSFHSLEDRLTKQAFTRVTTSKAPADLPVVPPSVQPDYELAVRGARTPSDAERASNPRSASTKMRAVRRIRVKGSQS